MVGVRYPRQIGIRLAFNRDESRLRPPGLPVRRQRCGGHEALMPIDAPSGGTWMGVNDAGLAMTLLNVYDDGRCGDVPSPRYPTSRPSRGGIIPALLRCSSASEAIEAAMSIQDEYPPFRLLVINQHECTEMRWDGRRMTPGSRASADRPMMFTSSGLGDAVVEPPRRALFEAQFVEGADLVAVQSAFHRHVWPDRPHLSICMSRAEARTVSHGVIEMTGDEARMIYYPRFPESEEHTIETLPLHR